MCEGEKFFEQTKFFPAKMWRKANKNKRKHLGRKKLLVQDFVEKSEGIEEQ